MQQPDILHTNKLEEMLIQLRDIIKIGTPYKATEERYACIYCKCYLGMRYQEKKYCLRCDTLPLDANTRKKIAEIMHYHPDREAILSEMREQEEAVQVQKEIKPIVTHTPRHSKLQYGMMVQEAREKLGMTRTELAHQIKRDDGRSVDWKMIAHTERGISFPRINIRKQLEAILGVSAQIAIEEERIERRKEHKIAYGQRIREAREAKGWTRTQLLSRLIWDDGKPVGYTALSKIENGENYPGDWLKLQLEQALGAGS